MDATVKSIDKLLKRIRDLEDRVIALESASTARREGLGRGKVFNISTQSYYLDLGWFPAPGSTLHVGLNGVPQVSGHDFEFSISSHGATLRWKDVDLRDGDVVDVQEVWE